MADYKKRQEELEAVLREGQGMDSRETAKQQLTAVEQLRPSYQESQKQTEAWEQLQQQEAARPQGYTPSEQVTQAQQQLNALQAPGEYQSQYQSQIQGILETINNRPAFNYQPENDPNYRVYRDMYTRMGERAAEDVQAQAAALTGGYGSSYGAAAGQQAYQGYLAELNNQVPTLMQLAEQRYQNEIANDYNKLSALQGLEEYAYGQYRDQVGDYQTERDYLAGRYDTEYSKDYGEYRDDVADYESELNYLFQKYGTLTEENMNQFLMELEQWENDREWYLNKYAMSPEEVTGSGGSGGSGSGKSSSEKDALTLADRSGNGLPAYDAYGTLGVGTSIGEAAATGSQMASEEAQRLRETAEQKVWSEDAVEQMEARANALDQIAGNAAASYRYTSEAPSVANKVSASLGKVVPTNEELIALLEEEDKEERKWQKAR